MEFGFNRNRKPRPNPHRNLNLSKFSQQFSGQQSVYSPNFTQIHLSFSRNPVHKQTDGGQNPWRIANVINCDSYIRSYEE